jgi:hypothetical protein
MGTIMRLTCENCGFSKDITLGAGMSDYNAEHILQHFEGKILEKAEQILSDPENGKSWDYDRVLGQCTDCKALKDVPILIGSENERIYEDCDCGGKLKLWIQDEYSQQQKDELPVCPECGNALNAAHAGLWD